MEHLRRRYQTSRQHYRSVYCRFLIAWTAFYALLALVIWQITIQLPTPGDPLSAELSRKLPLWGLAILCLLGLSLIQTWLRYQATMRLKIDRHAYEKTLKDLLSIARENRDTRGEVEAETELARLHHEHST